MPSPPPGRSTVPRPPASPALRQAMDLFERGERQQAGTLLRRLLQRDGRNAFAHYLLGLTLVEGGDLAAGLYQFEKAVTLEPGNVEFLLAQGQLLTSMGRAEEAIRVLGKAASASPGLALVDATLSKPLEALGRFAEAEAAARRALAAAPDDAVTTGRLAAMLHALGEPEAAADLAQRSALAEPIDAWRLSAWVCTLNYASHRTAREVFEAHARLGRVLDASREPLPPPPPGLEITPDPDRPLRVALLSPDFVQHPVSYFLRAWVRRLDPAQVRLIGVFGSTQADTMTTHLRDACAAWHTLPEPTEDAIIHVLRRERADVAIDLAGHTASSLLWPLRRRVCPIQMTYLGYPNTTGLPTIDYRLVDAHTDPPGPPVNADALATERLIRLDPCFLCYDPVPEMGVPELGPPPSTLPGAAGPVLASFNALAKLSDRTRTLWARVLAACPRARLLLKDKLFEHPQARARFEADLARRGVDPARLVFLPRAPRRVDHLAVYQAVDVALDPTPYHGTTTTCEALLMGVPVVTLAGDRHAARVGVSLLHAAGAPELIATDEDDYVRRVADTLDDVERRTRYRSPGAEGLRHRVLHGPLGDAEGFARRFERALRQAWQAWCARQSPSASG